MDKKGSYVALRAFPWIDDVQSVFTPGIAQQALDDSFFALDAWLMELTELGQEKLAADEFLRALFRTVHRAHLRVGLAQEVCAEPLSPDQAGEVYRETLAALEADYGHTGVFPDPVVYQGMLAMEAETVESVPELVDYVLEDEVFEALQQAGDLGVTVVSLAQQVGVYSAAIPVSVLPSVVVVDLASVVTLRTASLSGLDKHKPVLMKPAYQALLLSKVLDVRLGEAYVQICDTGGTAAELVTSEAGVWSRFSSLVQTEYVTGPWGRLTVGALNRLVLMVRYLPELINVPGYCYLRCVSPLQRLTVAKALGPYCTVRQLRTILAESVAWAGCDANVDMTDEVFHVQTFGSLPLDLPEDAVIGALPRTSQTRAYADPQASSGQSMVLSRADPYARQLMQDLILRGTRTSTTVAPDFLDRHRHYVKPDETSARLDTSHTKRSSAELDAVAREMLDDIDSGAKVYRRARVAESNRSVVSGARRGDWLDPADTSEDAIRLRSIIQRLEQGACISEKYMKAVNKRRNRGEVRPQVGGVRGRAFHVYDMYNDSSGATDSVWERDCRFHVPGWESFVHRVGRDMEHISLPSPADSAIDVRLDLSGYGAAVMGPYEFPVEGTVIWFRTGVRLRVGAGVSLRCFVPIVNSASNVGWELNRLGFVYGAPVIRDYDDLRLHRSVQVPMNVERRSTHGVAKYTATVRVPQSGTHALEFTGVNVDGPALVAMRSTLRGAIHRVFYAGVTHYPDSEDKVIFILDSWRCQVSIQMNTVAKVRVSVRLVEDPYVFSKAYAPESELSPVTPRQGYGFQ